MDVVAACDNAFVRYTAAMLKSLLAHNQVEHVSILVPDGFREYDRLLFQFKDRIALSFVPVVLPAHLKTTHHITAAAYLKLFIGAVPFERALYLDSDILIRGPLQDLWHTDLVGKILAAAVDPKATATPVIRERLSLAQGVDYFNSGVMLINLERWRGHDVGQRALAFAIEHPERITWWDQCALNYVIQGAFTPLPHCYNHQSTHGTAAIDEAIVVHFSGAHKPWRHNAMRHPLAQAYMNYLQGFA